MRAEIHDRKHLFLWVTCWLGRLHISRSWGLIGGKRLQAQHVHAFTSSRLSYTIKKTALRSLLHPLSNAHLPFKDFGLVKVSHTPKRRQPPRGWTLSSTAPWSRENYRVFGSLCVGESWLTRCGKKIKLKKDIFVNGSGNYVLEINNCRVLWSIINIWCQSVALLHSSHLLFIHMKAGRALDRQPCFPLYMPDFVYLSKSTWAYFLPVAELGAVERPQQPHVPVRRLQGVHPSVRDPTCRWAMSLFRRQRKKQKCGDLTQLLWVAYELWALPYCPTLWGPSLAPGPRWKVWPNAAVTPPKPGSHEKATPVSRLHNVLQIVPHELCNCWNVIGEATFNTSQST